MATSPQQMAPDDQQQALTSPPTAPRVRVRVPPMPSVRVRHATPFELFFERIRNIVLSEETLVLMEFLIVIAIGVVAFFTVFPTFHGAVDSIANYLNKQFGTSF
ncbi:MAG TPA: hypothetical protein VHB98_05585 [Chloroflexota bacterium]|jgi:hypothetical protein|nr:hypothetical protein [Chloroflexota bacterium]